MRILLGVHVGLIVAVGLTLADVGIDPLSRVLLIGAALVPLLACLPGLAAARPSVLPWLALALVAYAGLGIVEVIATRSIAASALLLLALLELALALTLRRPRPPQ